MHQGRVALAFVVLSSLGACAFPFSPASRGEDVSPSPSPTPTADPRVPPPSVLSGSWTDRSPFLSGLTHDEQAFLSDLGEATVYHAALELSDDGLRLEGAEEIYYVNREGVDLSEIVLHLYPEFLGATIEVLALEVGGEAAGAPASPAGGVLRVPLDPPLAAGQPVVLGLEFRLTVPAGPGAGYGLLAFTDDVLSLSHVLPVVAVYDADGWEVEPPAPHGDLVFSDAAFFLVRVSAPERFTLVASGVEIARQTEGGRQEVTYAAGPARDFFLAASERFTSQSQTADDVTIRSYTSPEFEETSPIALEHAAKALAIFEPMLGDFPYTELDIVTTGLQALGMEYPGAFALALTLYDPQNTRYGPVVLEATIVHELAHQWFFNLVGNDALHEPWLDEAMAQFATLAYFEEAYGPSGAEGFRESLRERWQRVGEAEIPIGMPVGAYTPQEYGAIVYGRGPLFLDELRQEMGSATFGEFLRDYVRSNRWQIVTTEGFRSLAEDHCRCDLGLLFADWVYSP